LGEILSGLCPVPEFLRVRELPLQLIHTISSTVTAVRYSPFVEIYRLDRSFCQQSPSSFINAIFQVIVYTSLFYNSKTKFLSLCLLNLILIRTAFFGSFLIFVVSFIQHTWLHLYRRFVTCQFT